MAVNDSFTGTDGTTLPTYSTNWVNPKPANYNNPKIFSNAVGANQVLAVSIYTGVAFTDNQYVQAKLLSTTAPGTRTGIIVRHRNGVNGDGYFLGFTSGSSAYRIMRLSDSATLATSATTVSVNDVVRLTVTGSSHPTLSVTLNGSALSDLQNIQDTTDAALSGYPGVYVHDTSSTAYWDDFEADSLGGSTVTWVGYIG